MWIRGETKNLEVNNIIDRGTLLLQYMLKENPDAGDQA